MAIPIIIFTAYSGSGKTTYLEKLLPCLCAAGLRVAMIKHDVHGFEMDKPGSDTHRLYQAGAAAVGIIHDEQYALIHKRNTTLDELAAQSAFPCGVER